MYQLDNEKFGTFLSEMRKEKNMTQKELAEKLFVSDKTVSKWERGASMPNVALLIPIAEVLEITVTELLRGERMEENKTLDTDEVESILINSLDLSVKNELLRSRKKRLGLYLLAVFMILGEFLVLLLSDIPKICIEEVSYMSGIMMLFAVFLCFFVKDTLPGYYDKNKISFVSQGVFKVHMVGLAFNNSNWPYVCKVFRIFIIAIAVVYPIMLYCSMLMGGRELWNQMKLIFIVTMLFMMMISAYIIGKKYE